MIYFDFCLLKNNIFYVLKITCFSEQIEAARLANDDLEAIIRQAESQVVEDFSRLLFSPIAVVPYDLLFKIGAREHRAHRTVMMARSPYFAEMLTLPEFSSENAVVEISDCNEQVFDEIMRFIYTGKITAGDGKVDFDLLVAADLVSEVFEVHIISLI